MGDRPDRAPHEPGKVSCCAIKDLLSNRIVGYALSDSMTANLAVNALRTAIARRQPDGVVIVHADRGSQFRARSFRAVLVAAGLQGSTGRVRAAGDNAAMESFWPLLQQNVLNRQTWATRTDLCYEIVYWIEHTDNRHRRHRGAVQAHPRRVRARPRRTSRPNRSMITNAGVNQTDSTPS